MRGVSRVDAAVAACFVVAALAEAVVHQHALPGLLAFQASGALWLGSLTVRRRWPLVPLCVIAAGGILGTTIPAAVWPNAPNSGGTWIVAMMLACYSLGAHGSRRTVGLGVLLPLLVVVAADATTMSGWQRISGILFVATFIGLLPTAAGRLVRARHDRLGLLRDQRELILEAQRARQESLVLAERLRTVERLQPTLLAGMQELAASAESAGDPAELEASARRLLARAREEVVALTAPTVEADDPELPSVDHLRALRHVAQPWAVLAAGALVAGLAVETSGTLSLAAPEWGVLPASLLAGAPLALAWWRPALAVAVGWVTMAAYSRLVAPLDGSLSETAFVFVATFAVAVLSRRRLAVVGLLLCLLGQLVGVGTGDPFGEGVLMVLCWLGGLAVNEVSRLVEQSNVNNELLAGREAASAAHAVVEERLRLAREIHDAIGHSLTVVALQSGAARRLAGTDPGRAGEVMRTVASVARSGVAALALDETTADIAGLVERVRAAGLEVHAELADTSLLDPGQRLTLFRVVQEGLTNVLRHAPGARVTVTVGLAGDRIEAAVVNSAPAGPGSGAGTGRGLAGIRERLTAVAGEAAWRAREDGGFEVRAWLPRSPAAVAAR